MLGQASAEYLWVTLIGLSLLTPVAIYAYQSVLLTEQFQTAKRAVIAIKHAVEEVGRADVNSVITLGLYIPPGISGGSISSNLISLRYENFGDIWEYVDFNVDTNYDFSPGYRIFKVVNGGDAVHVWAVSP